ncbi:tape measure protein [Aromatoleum toluclasticum]|uniref:tape measure protein n=1 Tax=Aromatoleum toluclasticum TaxID=92003 RepID=UPI001D18CC10|nr:tape measure protein [Aromatoleum toluclasticum]MCC4116347.1 tape measure protein [Aromatoleum toluclasticum]
MADLVAKLRLIAETSGKEGVEALAAELERLAAEGGSAAPRLNELSTALREIGKQPGMEKSAESATALGQAAAGAVDGVEQLGEQIGQAEQVTKTWHQFIAERMGPLMRQFAAEGVSHGEAHTRAIRQIAEEWKQYKASGVDANNAVTAAVGNGTAPLQKVASSAQVAAAALARIGIRSSDQIQAEINQINQDLIRLASNAKVSGTDFERAFTRAQERIADLQREMSGSVDPFTAGVGRATGGLGGLLTKLGPVGVAIATAFSVEHLARAAVEFDRINRTLEAIQGSGQATARELGYITEASQRLGLELASASRAYANFLASIKGTALEGQKGREVFEAISGAMSRLGKSSADTEGALFAVGQMVSKGVVSMEELRLQLAERLPGAMQAAANGAGVTVAELTKMVESGQVLAEDLLPGMAEELKKLYATSAGAEGYTASWNRFTNAITEAGGRLGQTDAVMKGTTGGLWLLEKATQGAGLVVLGFSEAVSLLGGSLGALAGAIASGNWSQLGDEISAMALKSGANLGALRDRLRGVQDASTGAGGAAKSAADQAMSGNPGWLAVANAYAQVTTSVDAYVKQAEKALEARQAETAAAVQFAQASGNEAQLRQAEAAGAAAVADATRRVAEAKAAQLSASQAELVTKQQVAAADGKESEAKRQLIEQIRQKVALQQEEAGKARAAAQSAQIEAAARKATAEAVRDNSGRLDELRAAYEHATEAVLLFEESERDGYATTEQVLAARAEATRAAILYNDAVADTIRNIQAETNEKQAALSVDEQLARLKIAQARTSEQIARSLGNEQAAVWAVVEAKRQEARIAQLRAQQARLEAGGSLQVAKAKFAELEAKDAVTKADIAALETAKKDAAAKQLAGKISEELAKQLNAEADAAIRAANAGRGVADAGLQMADGAQQAGQGLQQLGNDMESLGGRLGKIWQAAVEAIRAISPAAADAVGKIQASSNSFHEFSNGVRGLRLSAQELVTEGPLGDLTAELEAVRAETADVTTALEGLNNINSQMAAGLGFAGFWKGVAAMTELRRSLLDAKREQIEFSIEVQKFNDRVDEGNRSLASQESRLAGLVSRAKELGSQELSGLRGALESVRSQLRSIEDSARSTLDSISDELDQINGRYEAIERRRAAARRTEVETQLAQARASGDQAAAADLQRALSQLSELERVRLAEARARTAEDQARKEAEARGAAQPAPASPRPAAQVPTSTVRVEIDLNGRKTEINTSSQRDADALKSLLSQLESAMRTSS